MSYAKKTKLVFGSEATLTNWGLLGRSKGMYTGGHNYFMYSIKGLFAYTKYEAWGDMIRDNPHL